MKKRGSIVVANLEALTCVKEAKTAVIDAGKKQYHKSSNDQSSSDVHSEHDQLVAIRVTDCYVGRKNDWCENRSESDAS